MAVYILMLILAVMATVGGYNFIKVILNYVFEIETCSWYKTVEVCSTLDKRRLVEALALLLVSKPTLLTLWFLRKRV